MRVAQYVRMSTEHQRYSTQNQSDAIAKYAKEHDMEIVETFGDDGKSGLRLEGRSGLLRLLEEVQGGRAQFSAILVYDISRWGRFQDADESGYWEYVCKRAGVAIHYCAEQFANDGSMSSVILKNLKRTMAGEYSRELSVKVFAGQCRLIEHGYRQGGQAGFGLRRLLIDERHNQKEILEQGQRKSLQTDRVILVLGPENELAIVRHIYTSFTVHKQTETQIAGSLNEQKLFSHTGRPWTRGLIHQILTNPKYVGSNVYNRKSFKLKQRRVVNPEAMWVRKDNAFEAAIDLNTFLEAAKLIEARNIRFSDEEMLHRLRDLLLTTGKLSGIAIDEIDDMPSSGAYRSRFGSLRRAYTLVGYTPERDYSFIEVNTAVRKMHSDQVNNIISELRRNDSIVEMDPTTALLTINRSFTAAVVVARCRKRSSGRNNWLIRLEQSRDTDITVVARLEPENQAILDYYLLPRGAELCERIRLEPENPLVLDVYRFENLNFLYSLSRRVMVDEVA